MAKAGSALGKSFSSRRKAVKPKAISTSQEDWVRFGQLQSEQGLPLVIQPNIASLDLPSWIAGHRDMLEERLLNHGAILFRGFGLKNQEDFQKTVDAFGFPLLHYTEGATPRTNLGGRVYTSTEFPPEETIALHNELSYVTTWPRKICFFCLQAAETGGETPIADMRKVYQGIAPGIRDRFQEKGWMLVRNFGEGFGPAWQSSYRTEDKSVAERYFEENDIEFEWLGENQLRTRQVRPATARHPKTDENVWFNHIAFWHVSSLKASVRDVLLADQGEEGLPYNTYYGDGTGIEDEVIESIRDVHEEETIRFPWQEGDVLLADNMLVAHGRSPFTGPRKVLVSMGEPCSRRG